MKAALGFRRCKQNDDCEHDDDDEKKNGDDNDVDVMNDDHDDDHDVAKDSDDENYEKHYASRMVAQRCDQPTAVSAAAALDEQTRDVDAENARGDISVGGQYFLVLFDTGSDALILVGPEGDFSKTEVEQAVKSGFVPVSLASSRLRTKYASPSLPTTFPNQPTFLIPTFPTPVPSKT